MSREIKTLEEIVADVRSETGRSRNRNFGKNEYESIKYRVQREQRALWWDYQWRFLRTTRNLELVAGERYYDVPEGISFERITQARVNFGGQWYDLTLGIDEEDYNTYDSDNDARADPALKWDMMNSAGTPQIEIWPLPETALTCRFRAIGELADFISDNDNCTLDATLITLFTAGALKPEDQTLLARANRLLTKIRGNENRLTGGNRTSMAGAKEPSVRAPKRIITLPP